MNELVIESAGVGDLIGLLSLYLHLNPDDEPCPPNEARELFNQIGRLWRQYHSGGQGGAETPTSYPVGSIGDLITRYRASDEFKRLSEGTQSNYEVHMRRFEAHDTWGMVAVRDLAPITVQTARDAMKESAVMANQMLSVGRTIWDWAIPLDLAKFNPFDKVRDFDIPDRGHVPWPSWVIDYVRTHAWPDLVRMMRLDVMTCQRGSDLIRMGPSTATATASGVARSRPESAADPFTFLSRPPTHSRSTSGPRRR